MLCQSVSQVVLENHLGTEVGNSIDGIEDDLLLLPYPYSDWVNGLT